MRPTKQKKLLNILCIVITKNNLKVSIRDLKGNIILNKTEGLLKNIRKGSINSPDTSLIMMNQLAKDIKLLNIKELGLYLKGSTRWKKLSLRRLLSNLQGSKVLIKFIYDITGNPHNGCYSFKKKRKRKRRRLKRLKFSKMFLTKFNNTVFKFRIEKKMLKRWKKTNKFLKFINKIFKKTVKKKL